MKLIPLSRGMFAKVDDADFDHLDEWEWCAHRGNRGIWYASTRSGRVMMHQLIIGRKLVDHRNGDGLDNQRSNLRPVTKILNAANARKRIDAETSTYKGVSWDASRSRWKLQIKCGATRIAKRFSTELEAACAYDREARRLFGEYAKTNFEKGA